ncbi:hypothetical protein KP509_19G045900 [Ceratopteris richardii]|nr:hypothetical protein KP509_19G045900 [Ceratopteris richardii]
MRPIERRDVFPVSMPASIYKNSRGSKVIAAALSSFTKEQAALVKDTWAVLKKDASRHAMDFFLMVFDVAPAAKKLFSFLKDSDEPLEKNAKLKAHALQVFVIICESAASLSSTGMVSTPGSTMKDMARAHYLAGVVDEHYEVVRYCLLKTIQAGLPAGMWNEDVKQAWHDAYDELVREMRSQEPQTPGQ